MAVEASIVPHLRFRIGDIQFAIPLRQVWMILEGQKVEEMEEQPGFLAGVVPFYSGYAPVLDPISTLPVPPVSINPHNTCVLILQQQKNASPKPGQKQFIGLPVEQILGFHQISAEQISHAPQSRFSHQKEAPITITQMQHQTVHIVDSEKLPDTSQINPASHH